MLKKDAYHVYPLSLEGSLESRFSSEFRLRPLVPVQGREARVLGSPGTPRASPGRSCVVISSYDALAVEARNLKAGDLSTSEITGHLSLTWEQAQWSGLGRVKPSQPALPQVSAPPGTSLAAPQSQPCTGWSYFSQRAIQAI